MLVLGLNLGLKNSSMEYNDENLLALDAQGLSYKQIATQLRVTRNVVQGRLNRIRKKNPELVRVRQMGKHPLGEKPVHVGRKVMHPNKYTIFTKPFNYKEATKSELRAILAQAVKNTK